ncbi:MAG: ABC transporter ATP-binding protein [Flavobacteriaceae bacterium]|nr:ABC transporter ATP-binding protein [Flavobacteriaceae bacterium]
MPLIQIQGLNISFPNKKEENQVVHQLTYAVEENEILGIVGESGSGKSVSSLAIMGLLSDNASVEGKILFEEQDLLQFSTEAIRSLRGNEISMIFQEPMSSLNPSMKCGKQVLEVILQHQKLSKAEAKKQVLSWFEEVKLPQPDRIYKAYPHEISGGQKQRVMIAMAIANHPKLLIADEPTTALDVSVQKDILHLLKKLQKKREMSVIFISHDLEIVAQLADRVLVMYQGRLVEQNTVKELFEHPKEIYTKALLSSKPTTQKRLIPLPTVKDFLENKVDFHEELPEERQHRHQNIYAKAPLLEVKNIEKSFFTSTSWWKKPEEFKAVNRVSFKLYAGETMGLVGESGCGKSTLSNLILRLDQVDQGSIYYQGKDITHLEGEELRQLRKEIQLIFQDPFSSLNPKIKVGEAIMEPMQVHGLYTSAKERKDKCLELLEKVGLEASHFERYPHEFSGGQRQRIGIARTIAVNPKLIICDESVSALDISVQAQVLNLLNQLKHDFGFTYLFISHDLSVVKYMSDQLLVMQEGKIVEQGDADQIYNHPKQIYTKNLIEAVKL